MNFQNELKLSIIKFLETKDDAALVYIIDAHPEIISSISGEYPDLHRVVDISIKDKHYRVCREISNHENITLSAIDKPLSSPGVPLWLDGEKLVEWAKLEVENPSDEPTNWNAYR